MSHVDSNPQSMPLTLSIVSHGQGCIIRSLLQDLSRVSQPIEVIVTLNIKEDETFLKSYSGPHFKVIRNTKRAGFGANHNAAFKQSVGDVFAVVNPDIRFDTTSFEPLLTVLTKPSVGACAPRVLNPEGHPEDHARRFPTLYRMFLRRFLGRRTADYDIDNSQIEVDWVAGMFVVFRRDAFVAIGGFDERFFMYMEDVDICRRLLLHGYKTVVEPASFVIHDARRASHKNLQHFYWHSVSAFRFLTRL